LWAAKMTRLLQRRQDSSSLTLCQAELEGLGNYWLYTVSDSVTRAEPFSLVVCDGPPGDTPCGGFGLFTRLGHRLVPHCVILLDDIARADEQQVVERWIEEYGLQREIASAGEHYARLFVPER
jgi:hypothetical protein